MASVPRAIGDFERLGRMAEALVAEYDDGSLAEWEASPIGWIRQVSSAHKRGKIGEEIVRAWAGSEGLAVAGPGVRAHECVIGDLRIEVKTSLRWNNDRFVFLGLRDFDYHGVALLGLAPNDLRLWIVPKELLWERAQKQLRGAGRIESKWLSFAASKPPAWLEGWGGSFAQARNALEEIRVYDIARQGEIEQCESWMEMSSDIDWPWESGEDGIGER